MKLSDIIKAINVKTYDENLINEYNKDEYPAFIINRIFSNFPDTIYHSYNLNKFPYLDKELQYKYMYYSIASKSRFCPIIKEKTESDEKFSRALAEEYGISEKSALKHYKRINHGR